MPKMRRPSSIFRTASRFAGVFLLSLCIVYFVKLSLPSKKCNMKNVDPVRVKRTQIYAKEVLERTCQPSFAKKEMYRLFREKYSMNLASFISDGPHLNESSFKYGPPFGFHKYIEVVRSLLKLMPDKDLTEPLKSKTCKRCIVVGNGGILHGLQMGHAVDQYDIVIRLNNAPVHGFAKDVGNKTTIRMTYPEGAPVSTQEYHHNGLFVAVFFKSVDFRWLQAMLKNESLSMWNRMFFWKQVAENIPVQAKQFRILNPLIIKETAIDILQYPEPRDIWWGWDKNVPTLGCTAVVMATHLCDEVSLAGFGYDLSQLGSPLHYYDDRCMAEMKESHTHDVTQETKLLQTLVKEGVVKDITGGIHCQFCNDARR
ncbi:lactosylceramide alpha-2,3-sialyltransferase isoform X2 [Pleurodeles waltl]